LAGITVLIFAVEATYVLHWRQLQQAAFQKVSSLRHPRSVLSSSAVMWSVEMDEWECYLRKPQEMAFLNVNWLCTVIV
jgi:hypothetical protein